MSGIAGIGGHPFLDLERHLDLAALPDVHEEVCLALAQLPVDYTGGSHKSMGIVPPSLGDDPWVDYGHVLRRMSEKELATFVSLSDDPPPEPETVKPHQWGEERDHPLSRRQMLYLKYRYGVYFPWKVYYELIPNRYWDEKSSAEGKSFTRQARAFFPRTIAFVSSLPFSQIGRCNVMGLEANDHGTVHRDGVPADKPRPDHFVTVVPGPKKRLFLWSEEAREKVPVLSSAYWFNDSDYHGVEADPHFRYSIRVDGVFRPDFVEALRRDFALSEAVL
jgi:hypothetical protein